MKQSGFTLIEIMVTVAIVAILATIALPSYQEYVTRSRFSDATSALANKRVQIEQFFQDARTYEGAPGCADDDADSASPTSTLFDFSCGDTANENGFTLTASGRAGTPMAGFTFTINEAGNRASTVPAGSGWTANPNCWIRAKGGTC